MIYGLTESDLQRIDKEAVKKMIVEEEKRLNIWSISNYEKNRKKWKRSVKRSLGISKKNKKK